MKCSGGGAGGNIIKICGYKPRHKVIDEIRGLHARIAVGADLLFIGQVRRLGLDPRFSL